MSMMNYYDYGQSTGYWPFAAVDIFFMILWWVFLIVVIVSIVRWAIHAGRRHDKHEHWGVWKEDSAMKILKDRYARGEIDKKEFDEKKQDLS